MRRSSRGCVCDFVLLADVRCQSVGGRCQLCVLLCFFIVDLANTMNVGNEDGLSDGLQIFEFGLSSVPLLDLCHGSLWLPLLYCFPFQPIRLQLCVYLLLESTGICSGAWVLAGIDKMIAGLKRGEEYIGTVKERGRKNLGDDDDQIEL